MAKTRNARDSDERPASPPPPPEEAAVLIPDFDSVFDYIGGFGWYQSVSISSG